MEGLGLENCVGAPSIKGNLKGGMLLCPLMESVWGGERLKERTPRATWKEFKGEGALTGSQGVRGGKLTWKGRITVQWDPFRNEGRHGWGLVGTKPEEDLDVAFGISSQEILVSGKSSFCGMR